MPRHNCTGMLCTRTQHILGHSTSRSVKTLARSTLRVECQFETLCVSGRRASAPNGHPGGHERATALSYRRLTRTTAPLSPHAPTVRNMIRLPEWQRWWGHGAYRKPMARCRFVLPHRQIEVDLLDCTKFIHCDLGCSKILNPPCRGTRLPVPQGRPQGPVAF